MTRGPHPLIGKTIKWSHGDSVLVGPATHYDVDDDELFIVPPGLMHGHYWVPARECVEFAPVVPEQPQLPTEAERAWRKAIADQVRLNCTPSSEAYAKGGDVMILAVAEWIENPPEWSKFTPPVPAGSEREAALREAASILHKDADQLRAILAASDLTPDEAADGKQAVAMLVRIEMAILALGKPAPKPSPFALVPEAEGETA